MDIGRRYLELVLRLRKLAPWTVDSYTGPPELAARIDSEQRSTVPELVEQAHDVLRLVQEGELDEDRRESLSAQLSAISTALTWLGGERFGYRELVDLATERR